MADQLRTGYWGMQIALHWLVVALVLLQLLIGEDVTFAMEAIRQHFYISLLLWFEINVHYYVGIAILLLTLIQLALRFVWSAPPPAQQGWMAIAATASHASFYFLLLAMPILGLLAYDLDTPFSDLHRLGKPLLIALIGIHTAAALYHQFWLKDGTLRRMLIRAP